MTFPIYLVNTLLLLIFTLLLGQGSAPSSRVRPLQAVALTAAVLMGLKALRWHWQITWAQPLQALLAMALPLLIWRCFAPFYADTQPKFVGQTPWWSGLPILAVPLLFLMLPSTWLWMVDLLLSLHYLVYAALVFWVVNSDRFLVDRLVINDSHKVKFIGLWVVLFLSLSVVIDVLVFSNLNFADGRFATLLLQILQSLMVPLLVWAIVMLGRLRFDTSQNYSQALPTALSGADPVRVDVQAGLTTQAEYIVSQLQVLMERDQWFCDPDLSLIRIARKLGVPSRQVSEAVNTVTQKSISQYINQYRVNAAKKALSETDLTITQIMFDSGFQTKSNFNREFSKSTGLNPSQYRQSHLV